MGSCYNCGKQGKEAKNLKQEFSIKIQDGELFKKKLFIRVNFWRDENTPTIPFGLCRGCMIKAFEQGAEELREMSDSDFEQTYY